MLTVEKVENGKNGRFDSKIILLKCEKIILKRSFQILYQTKTRFEPGSFAETTFTFDHFEISSALDDDSKMHGPGKKYKNRQK